MEGLGTTQQVEEANKLEAQRAIMQNELISKIAAAFTVKQVYLKSLKVIYGAIGMIFTTALAGVINSFYAAVAAGISTLALCFVVFRFTMEVKRLDRDYNLN